MTPGAAVWDTVWVFDPGGSGVSANDKISESIWKRVEGKLTGDKQISD